jgi:hypothetical protein
MMSHTKLAACGRLCQRASHRGASAAATAVALCIVALLGVADGGAPAVKLTDQARLAAIRRAQVWVHTDVPTMNLRAGPPGPGAFQPNETVTCDYVKKKMNGNSPKFTCAISPGDEVKVKYGVDNGEVYGEVGATRLLWALGFGADRMYPVRVVCRGCPPDPKNNPDDRRSVVTFDPAAIERKMHGHALENKENSGWAWPELDLVDEAAGGAPRAQRDALKLLAVVMQHTDSKREQQRLVCVSGEPEDQPCRETFMILNDVGLTFGHANTFNHNGSGSVNFDEWSRTSVWKDSKRCVGNLPKSMTGTLENPLISESGRKFLADLLVQLSDAQLHELFDVARFPLRSRSGGAKRPVAIDQWVDAFKQKRDEVVNRTCP